MDQQNIQLYKIRDFGAKINATIEYIRHNIGALVKVVLLIIVPLALLFGIIMSQVMSDAMRISANANNMSQSESLGFMGSLLTNYAIIFGLSTITTAFLLASVFGYMKLNNSQESKPEVMEVYGSIIKKVPMLLLLIILISIVTMIGFAFFVLPGIYLAITLSLAIPIYMFENEGIGGAFSKSFKLIKGKWWSTFGILLVTGIIASVISYLFAIPLYALMMGKMFTLAETNDPEAVFSVFSSWYTIVGMTLMMIGSYVTYLIPVIGLAFQYFNLSERVEGKGLRNQIKEFETVA